MFDWLLGKGGRAFGAPDESGINVRRKAFDDAYGQGADVQQALAQQALQAQGRDSAGQALLRQGANQAVAEQASQAASARGGAMQLAAARTAAMGNSAQIMGQSANQAAQLQSEELARANQARAAFQAQREQAQLGALNAETGLYGAKTQMAIERGKAENDRSKGFGQTLGTAAMVGGAALMMSDERAKDAIQPASDDELARLLDAQNPTTYRYKGQDTTNLGVIAQDLEASDLGRLLVVEGDDGLKRIDKDAALAALLAEVGYLHDQINDMRGGGK